MESPTLFFSLVAGFVSVLSPCVLPVIPIIVIGRENDSRLRPLLIVLGLSFTFILMGIASTLFGQIVAPYIYSIEKISGGIILLFGVMFLFDLNLFKKIVFFNRLNYRGRGTFSGLILGAVLGLIWIPCVGPVLTSILALVASVHQIVAGLSLLVAYSVGFAIPLLVAGYFAHFFRERAKILNSRPLFVRLVSGAILIGFGFYILIWGMVGIGA